MNVMIIGSGGREHALAWKMAQSPQVTQVFVAPGNAGTHAEKNVSNLAIDVLDFKALAAAAKDHDVALTVVGPEVPLVAGIVDFFESQGLAIFGPRKGAAQLEGSKAFSKDFLARHQIPTAFYSVFTQVPDAVAYIREKGVPIVIKADGLAAGKGVIIANTEAEAFAAVENILSGNRFGDAGARVVVEEFLVGEEASFIVMVDGDHVLPMATSQDHKALKDGDMGPNTGGMGAYSPAPIVDDAMHRKIMETVIYPTVEGMKAEGNAFTGFLYAGVMVSPDGTPNVLEFNVRFGDPETQPIMMRLTSDFFDLCMAGVNNQLDQVTATWAPEVAMGVVMAAPGYPDDYPTGQVIGDIPQETTTYKCFHAGTKIHDDQVVTSGGRVLCIVGLGATAGDASAAAYSQLAKVDWPSAYYRTDIGYRAIARELQER